MAASRSYTEALRRLGMRPAGGNHETLRKYVRAVWRIPVDHFDPYAYSRTPHKPARPLADVLTEGSSYDRARLKRRLYESGLKTRACEMCAQTESWHGRQMALILDHVNGVADDNRLENLRIVCANCAATLDTHCGRNLRLIRPCAVCGTTFKSFSKQQRHCSLSCGARSQANIDAKTARRSLDRPPYMRLLAEVNGVGYRAVGRRYGVSDNAIRKWIRRYERELTVQDHGERERAEHDNRDARDLSAAEVSSRR